MFSLRSTSPSPSTSANAEPESTRSTGRWGSSVADRPTIDVATPAGGWGAPWPNVAEIEAVLPHDKWTLVGGLMAQLHGIHAGIDALRPTNDVDIVIHYDPPEDHKSYLHRSGRTARAGESGLVVTLVLWNEELEVKRLLKRTAIEQPIVEVFSNDKRLADLSGWNPALDPS